MSDEPTLRELANLFELKLSDARDDILDLKQRLEANALLQREQFGLYVLSAVYEADKKTAEAVQKATDKRVEAIEAELVSARQGSRNAFLMSVGTLLAAIALAAFSQLVRGGH